MTHILINTQIVQAIGLSIAFMGIMLSIISVGISFLIYKTSKRKGMGYLKMAGLITSWAVFIFLALMYCRSHPGYSPIFFNYSLMHIIATLLGIIIILSWLFMLPKLLKIFDKKLLITSGIIASLSILERIIFPFLSYNPYLGLIMRITIIIPPLLGFFMIIKSYCQRKGR